MRCTGVFRDRMSEVEALLPPPAAAEPASTERQEAWRPVVVPSRGDRAWRRPPGSFRRHLSRTLARITILLAADVAAFVVLRASLSALRNGRMLGPSTADFFRENFTGGYLGGWQYATALVLGLAVAGAYARGEAWKDGSRVFVGVMLATGLTLWHSVWTVGLPRVALQGLGTILAVGLALLAVRIFLAVVLPRVFPGMRSVDRMIFVGDPSDPTAKAVVNRLLGGKGIAVQGWVHSGMRTIGQKYLGRPEEIWGILGEHHPDTVLFIGQLDPRFFQTVMEAATTAGCRILSLSQYDGLGSLSPRLWWHRGLPFVELTLPALSRPQYLVKRLIDVMGSALGLVLLAPVFLAIGVIIKLESPGPVFFRQERAGFGGRVFRMLKFRSMRQGADAEKASLAHLNHTGDARLFKIPDDPRVTKSGAWLRRWSLDELPQLWNVLVGDMSLVGPRPFFEGDLAHYRDHHFGRLATKPGITGLWQVNGRSSLTDFEDVVRMDREYIDRWSLWLDLKILLRTIPAVLRRTGAY